MNPAAMPSSHAADNAARFATGQYRPVTFLQRGLAVPFTTPHLMGGRIRPGDRGLAELALINPTGKDYAYILPWSALPDVCTPTLHDRALWTGIAKLTPLVPRTVRDAARQVAIAGFAGRAAARAAEAVVAEDLQARTRTHYHLLLELVRQGERRGIAGPPPEADSPRRLEQRARAVLVALESGGQPSAMAAFEALAEVAEAFPLCGLPRNPTKAAIPALLVEIGRLTQDLVGWAGSAPEEGLERQCVRLICQSARLTLRCCRLALAEALAPLEDLPALLGQWRCGRSAAVQECTIRPEWLLDGWAMICGLWRTADHSRRHGAVMAMATMVPILPAEAGDWLRLDASAETEALHTTLGTWRRVMQPNQDWMTGRMLDLIARNEMLRAANA
ncbi:MAG: hypothetical protein JWP04_3961 [Belnapia sp.]|nr:hypothetical protein [Belnapia sp.]